MTDYTPTTADIEAEYGRIGNGPERRAAFHRWLAEHERQVKAEAWDEGHKHRHRLAQDECQCDAWNIGECACGLYGTGELLSLNDNPYREVTE